MDGAPPRGQPSRLTPARGKAVLGRKVRNLGGSTLLLALAGSALAAGSADAAVTESVRLVLSPTVPAQLPARSLIEVRWGGEPASVTSVRSLDASRAPWEITVYVDAPTTRPEALARWSARLAELAQDLAAVGEIAVVVADPEPRRVAGPTRDPQILATVFSRLEGESRATGELPWLRQRYAMRLPLADREVAAEALRAEERLALAQSQAFTAWLAPAAPRSGAASAVLLISDGFDLEPEAYYSRALDEPLHTAGRLRRAAEASARTIAGAGWRVLPLALGDGAGELVQPHEPLSELARASGGRVVSSPRALARELESLERRIEVDVLLPGRLADGAGRDPLPVEIRWPGEGAVDAPRWAAVPGRSAGTAPEPAAPGAQMALPAPAGKAIRLVPPPTLESGEARVALLTTRGDLAGVELLLDGRPLTATGPPPLEVRIGLDLTAGPVRLEARAFDATGDLVGGDLLILGQEGPDLPRVEIGGLEAGSGQGFDLSAEVHLEEGQRVERVELFWNEVPVGTVDRAPYRIQVGGPAPRPGDFARAVAHLNDGSVVEAARFAREEGLTGALDVNLVEVYALVRARSQTPSGLEREDFSLYRGERQEAIEEFARAGDLPLELGLAIDTSSSMERWMPMVRRAAARFLDTVLRPGDEGFLVDFDDRPRLAHAPTRDHESLVRRFGGLRAAGDTALYDSMLYALLQFDAPRARRALVVLSDGRDAGSRFGPEKCIEQARAVGVPIYMIALGDPPDQQRDPRRLVHYRVAAETGGAVYHVASPDGLDEIYRRITEDLESHYLLTFSTDRSLSQREMQEIRVRVRDPRLTVRTVVAEGL